MARFAFLKQIVQDFGNDKVGQLSAAFSYGAIFSIGPLLLVVISIAGFVFGPQAVQGKLFTDLSSALGPTTARAIQDVVVHTHSSSNGAIALVLGIIGMLLGAAGITSQLQSSFNAIFSIVPDPKGGIKRTIYVKIKNVFLVILGSLFVAASVVVSAIIISLGAKVQQHLGIPPTLLEIINNAVSLLIFILMIYLLYRTLPDVVLPRTIVLGSAVLVSFLFLVGKVVLGLIIGRNSTASAYGAAAALVSLLLWIYYSGQILFIGAVGIKVYGARHELLYTPKKFNLKRTTINIDSKDFKEKLIDAWARGVKKGIK